uniref:Uncharacterized protein n=1 Tax=Arundo donax TaxID=35708 RepID=A0A0A9D9H9_ARUDO
MYRVKKGVPSAESSHTRWGLGKRISRQPYPCKIPLKFCKEASSNPGPPGHKWRVSTTAPGPPFNHKHIFSFTNSKCTLLNFGTHKSILCYEPNQSNC